LVIQYPEDTSVGYCGSIKSGRNALGARIEHPTFGKICVFNTHLSADLSGLACADLCGSTLQLKEMQILVEYVEQNICPEDTDNLLICGDFNEMAVSSTLTTLLQHQGTWGPFIDCAFETSDGPCLCPAGTIPSACCPPVKGCCCCPPGLIRLDYCMLSARSSSLWPSEYHTGNVQFSDHRPLCVDFIHVDQPQIRRHKPYQIVCLQTRLGVCVTIVLSILATPCLVLALYYA